MDRSSAVAALCSICIACGGRPSGTGPPPPDAAIDTYKELIAVDETVVQDARAANANDGPWSFRFLMEQLAPQNPAAFVESWLRTFRQATIAGAKASDRSGVETLLSAWPRAPDGTLDLSRAPFRLLAIVNRLDLPRGEGRLVYGLQDPHTGAPGRLTVGFEFALPGTAQEWARRWHALGSAADYPAALEALTRSFTRGDSLSQLRTNEQEFGDKWEMRQWVLAGGALQPVPVPSTPAQQVNDTPALAYFLHDNAAAILAGSFSLPAELQGGAAVEGQAWTLLHQPYVQVDAATLHAFAAQTCNGCHSGETQSARGFFHVDPFAPVAGDGRDRLSTFLKDSQLPRRAANLASLLQGGPPLPVTVPPLPPAPAVKYDAAMIPDDGASTPVALDARGRILANSAAGPWIWDGSSRLRVSGPDFHATGFDASGNVTGYTGDGDSRRAVLVSADGLRHDLGTLGGLSLASGIDAAGAIAGDSVTAAGDHHGFVLANGSMRDLGTLGGSETMTSAISATGRITGESQLADGTRHAFLFDGAQLRDLGTLGGGFAIGQAVNARGQVAGFSEMVPGDDRIHAFFHDGVSMRDLGILPGLPWVTAPGLNDQGVVVGEAYNQPDDGTPNYGADDTGGYGYDTYGYVYAGGVMTNLNGLVPPGGPRLRAAIGINDAGQILCSDGQAGQTGHAWLLTPR